MGRNGLDMVVERFAIYLVNLDPTLGSEINKTRPCAVVSPDDMNLNIRTAIIAPMTSTRKGYPSRVPCTFAGRQGEIVLDQIRTVDQVRLVKRLGVLSSSTSAAVVKTLLDMFR
jgi:mRNA interferase MazF